MGQTWTKKEEKIVLKLLKNNKTYKEISEVINRSADAVAAKSYKLSVSFEQFNKHNETRNCKECNKKFVVNISNEKKFCSHSCSAKQSNVKRKKIKNCLNCNKQIEIRNVYCNNKCQGEYKKKKTFEEIENGNKNLFVGAYKRYLINKHGEKCMECGWAEINKHSGKIPVELEHIDGNGDNNDLKNLKLLCPNHHSLTSTYRALNIGNGRKTRKMKNN